MHSERLFEPPRGMKVGDEDAGVRQIGQIIRQLREDALGGVLNQVGHTRGCLTFQQRQFIGFAIPLIGIGGRFLAFDDGFPARSQFGIEGGAMLLVCGHVILGENGFGRTLSHTQGTIDAFVRVDDQKIRAFTKAINGTNIYAISIFTLDAIFGDDVSHSNVPSNIKYGVRAFYQQA